MKSQLAFVSIAAALIAACTAAPTPTTNADLTNAAANSAVNAAIAGGTNVNTTSSPNVPVTAPNAQNPFASPSSTLQTYYQALTTNDEQLARRALSRATLQEYADKMSEEGFTSVVKFENDLVPPPPRPYTIRNEQVTGSTAVVTAQHGGNGSTLKFGFVREGDQWKLDQTDATTAKLLSTQRAQ